MPAWQFAETLYSGNNANKQTRWGWSGVGKRF